MREAAAPSWPRCCWRRLVILLQLNGLCRGTRRGIAGAGRDLSAGQTGDLVAATGAGLHLRLGRADGLRGRGRPARCGRPRCSTPRRSRGFSATTRSTRTRTARTTRWSACAPRRGCSASATRPFLAACYATALVLLLASAGAAADCRGFDAALVIPAGVCWPGRSCGSTSDDPGLVPAAVQGEPRGGAGGGAGDRARAAVSRPGDRVHPRQLRCRSAARRWCRRSRCISRPRLRRSGRRPRTGCAERNVAPPFWAFAWPGEPGARAARPRPSARRSPAGACSISPPGAAWRLSPARARRRGTVEAAEIDPLAIAAIRLNAGAQRRGRRGTGGRRRRQRLPLGPHPVRRRLLRGADDRATSCPGCGAWRREAEVWIADPGRAYVPADGLAEFARMPVPTTVELEDRTERTVRLFRLTPLPSPTSRALRPDDQTGADTSPAPASATAAR